MWILLIILLYILPGILVMGLIGHCIYTISKEYEEIPVGHTSFVGALTIEKMWRWCIIPFVNISALLAVIYMIFEDKKRKYFTEKGLSFGLKYKSYRPKN